MSTVAVLFVNLRQSPHEDRAALLAAQRLGYEVILLADRVPSYAAGFVSEVETVNTYDLEQALAKARLLINRHHVRGVVTWGDRDVELIAQIGQSFGLPAPSPAAARRARNKFEMKQALAHLPGIVPQHARVRTLDELKVAVREIGLPAVLKPTGASGSKGIFELRRPEDLLSAFTHLQNIARPDFDPIFHYYGAEFILEEFLSGPEFSVEGWIYGGEVWIAGITDKWTTNPFHLEYQHIHPSRLAERDKQEVLVKTVQVVKALGLDNSTFHLEGKLTPQGFRLVEVAARIGGDYITSHLVPLSTGIDFYAQVIRVATGKQPIVEPQHGRYAGVRFLLANTEGLLVGLKGIETMLSLTAVEHLFVEQAPGNEILLPPRHFDSQRIAAVIARHADYALVDSMLKEAAHYCTADVVQSRSAPISNSETEHIHQG